MASLFGALGSLAESYGLAHRNILDEQKQQAEARLAEERVSLEKEQIEQEKARTLIDQLNARRPFPMGQPYKRDGKWIQSIWDPLKNQGQGGLGEIEEGADENPIMELMRRVKEAGGTMSTSDAINRIYPLSTKTQDQYEERTIMAPGPGGKLVPTIAFYDKTDPTKPAIIKPEQAFEREPAGAAAELPEKQVAELANQWNKWGTKPPAKFQAQVESYMDTHGMEPGRKLSDQEQRVIDTIKMAQPKVTELKKIIEDHGLTEDSSFLFSNYSALAEYMRYKHVYMAGVKPDQLAADMIKRAGLLQVMGIAPWTIIGRGKWTADDIKPHLVEKTDTPGQLYDKLNFFQTIIDDANTSITRAGAIHPPGGGGLGGGSARDFGPAPPGKPEGSTGTIDGTKIVVRNGRLVSQ